MSAMTEENDRLREVILHKELRIMRLMNALRGVFKLDLEDDEGYGLIDAREMVTGIASALQLSDVERVGLYAAAGMIPTGMACTVIVTGGRVMLVGLGESTP